MSKTKPPRAHVAVIGLDTDAVDRRVLKLRNEGHMARGLDARFWDGRTEPRVTSWVVIAATAADANDLATRVADAYARAGQEVPEIAKVHPKPETKPDA